MMTAGRKCRHLAAKSCLQGEIKRDHERFREFGVGSSGLIWLVLGKQKSGKQYGIALEPFEGAVTALIPLSDRGVKWMCKP